MARGHRFFFRFVCFTLLALLPVLLSLWLGGIVARCSLLVLHTFSCLTLTEKMATVESIKTLLDTSACNAEIVPQLVAHVHAQASGSVPYHADANRSLIKLYTFFPHLEDEHTIALVLLLALVEFPSTDILSLSCLIPERVQSRDPCASILRCV